MNNQLLELTITAIGGMGEGIAHYDGKPVFVPLTCPGDKIKAEIQHTSHDQIRTAAVEIISPSDQRQTPPCQHFGRCGGCSLQHLNKQTYNNFKQDILTQIIKRIGGDISVIAPMIEVGPQSRRRAEFKIAVNKGEISIGFFAPKSHDIIELAHCPISEDRLISILPALKEHLQSLKKPGILKAISLTALDSGLDAIIITRSAISESDRQLLIQFAKDHNIVRISEHVQTPETSHISPSSDTSHSLYDSGKATINFGGVDIALPIGAFLQATHKGQMAITTLVTKHLQGCKRVVDLYSGCGTYSFPLIKQAKSVAAFEGGAQMVSAMHNAIIRNDLDGKMTASTRDLVNRPLKDYELNRFDGIVINPPRNGALPQVKNIGSSTVGKVVMVSCSPATFERDAKYLIDEGYELTFAVALDQFYWTGHLEIIAVFEK